MRHSRRTVVRLAAAGVVAVVVGCDQREHSTAPELGPDLAVDAPKPQMYSPTIDDEFDRLAKEEIPGFGGLYFDEDLNPVIYLTDPNRRTDAERWVEEVQTALGSTGRTLVVRKADYYFSQLCRWRDMVSSVMTRDGVFSLASITTITNSVTSTATWM